MSIIYCLVMAALSRMSGGGLGAKYLNKKGDKAGVMPFDLSFVPEVFFAAGLAAGAYALTGSGLYSFVALLWSYIFMQTGHGAVLPWGRPVTDPAEHAAHANRKQTLSPVVDALARLLGIQNRADDGLHTVEYCRLFMAVKGALIGLPVLLAAIPLAILWPLSYEIGVRLKRHDVAELAAGLSAGLSVVFAVAVLS